MAIPMTVKKVMISLPPELLQTVDDAAARLGVSRSEFVRGALTRRIVRGEPDLERRRRAGDAIRELLRNNPDTSGMTPEELIRYERDVAHGDA